MTRAAITAIDNLPWTLFWTNAFNAHYAKEQAPEKRPRVQLKHKALVNGFIMSQVLDKPRALKPYEEIQ